MINYGKVYFYNDKRGLGAIATSEDKVFHFLKSDLLEDEWLIKKNITVTFEERNHNINDGRETKLFAKNIRRID